MPHAPCPMPHAVPSATAICHPASVEPNHAARSCLEFKVLEPCQATQPRPLPKTIIWETIAISSTSSYHHINTLFGVLERKTNERKSTPANSIVSQPHSRTRLTPPPVLYYLVNRRQFAPSPSILTRIALLQFIHTIFLTYPFTHYSLTHQLINSSTHQLTPALGLTHQWAHKLD